MAERLDSQTAQFPPGTMLDDKYRIDRLLAVGGMGAVYVGAHTKLKKKVAIKVLRTELANADGVVERFQREAIAASQIGHDNIVEVTDLGTTEGGVAFLVMEYLAGQSLAARIKKDGALPVGRAADIGIEILSAMDAAHATNIIHRDLKPENIFLAQKSRGETVKVLDFGISRVRSMEDPDARLTQTGVVMGTPYYMSPEQARGASDMGPASDIYSTGVILYEMVTGELPYEADNYNMVMFRVISGEWVLPRARKPALPVQLEEIICKAMALDPADRYASANELAQALAPFAETATPSEPAVPSPIKREPSAGFATAQTVAHGAQHLGTADTVAHPTGEAMGLLADPTVAGRKRSPLAAIIATVIAGVGAAVLAFGGVLGGGDDTTSPVAHTARAAADKPELPTPAAAVSVEFAVGPDTARIVIDGEPLDGVIATRTRSDAPVPVRIEADGHVPVDTTVTFDVAQRLQFDLAPIVVDAGPSAAPDSSKSRTKKRSTGSGGNTEGNTDRNTDRNTDDDTDDDSASKRKKKKRIVSDSPYE